MDRINLFCLPYAGGNAYSYRGFLKIAPKFLGITLLELPGRGNRVRENLLKNIHLMADDIFLQIKSKLNDPYAIYGHSMGTLLGYLITKRIIEEGLPQPLHLFFTGCRGPSVTDGERNRYLLPTDLFIESLRELDGSPEEILNDPMLMAYFEPIIRADFEAVDKFEYVETAAPFHIPITVINGLNEKATYDEALAWQKETTEKIEVRQFPGKHFFIFKYEHEILKIIVTKLSLNSKFH